MKLAILAFAFCVSASFAAYSANISSIDLSGKWSCVTADTTATVTLPGTLDTNGVGKPCSNTRETTHLSRRHSYVGEASYSCEFTMPREWRGRNVVLTLERAKPATVIVDGDTVGCSNDISTPQRYDLGNMLAPGKHRLEIVVDNSDRHVPHQLLGSSHAYTEDTQTNWNGVIGDISLTAPERLRATGVMLSDGRMHVTTTARPGEKYGLKVQMDTGKGFKDIYSGKAVGPEHAFDFRFDSEQLWSEFSPNTYPVRVLVNGKPTLEQKIGYCRFGSDGRHFTVNGRRTFLRGKHDACVFPLTGHVPMDVESWRKYLGICKEYGVNHIRFHSWCPPEACFTVADELGVYLQPELPFWGDFNSADSSLMTFLAKEGDNIVRTYGHHPSFVMMALGNELWGDIDAMKSTVDSLRTVNPEVMYTFGSNYYLGYKGVHEGMDFFVTCRNGGEAWGDTSTHTRGSFSYADAADGGLLNTAYPNSVMTLDSGCESSTVPVISHETGQFQSYPDFAEIQKYTGVLSPDNLIEFKRRLDATPLAPLAEKMHRCSGALATMLYKADIELDLRTKNMAGFQLLDLQDYPGQGSAYVGILDAFMDSKGYITPREWRGFCSPVVLMFETPRFCLAGNQSVTGSVVIANYGPESLRGKHVDVTLDIPGRHTYRRVLPIDSDSTGLINLGEVTFPSADIDKATRMTVTVAVDTCVNSYPLWIYPEKHDFAELEKTVKIATSLDKKTLAALARGERVLLMPDTTQYAAITLPGLFQTDYWNYRMFRTICENNKKVVSPGTLGLMIDNKSAALADFPTAEYSEWQWFAPVKASRSLILDNFPAELTPIVSTIDNIERNHRLGMIMEMNVGRGSLLICMTPLSADSPYPESRQLYASLLRYMSSDAFAPSVTLTPEQLLTILSTPISTTSIDALNNLSFD